MPDPTLRVALVDDNADILESLSLVVELLGHQSLRCATGEDAVTRIASWQPHVALVDVGLPGMSGYDVARTVRATMNGDAPVLIAVTGWNRDEDLRRAKEAGFDRHVVKPLDLSALRVLLDDVASAL